MPVGPLAGDTCVSDGVNSFGVFTDTQLNSANLIQTVPLTAFGLSAPAKIQYFTYSYSNLGVDLSGHFSFGNAPIDVAPDKFATSFDPNNEIFNPVSQTVGQVANSLTNDSVTTNNNGSDLEAGLLSYYQNNDPSATEAEASLTRVGLGNLLFTYMPGLQAKPLAQELKLGQFGAYDAGLANYLSKGVITPVEYNLLRGLSQGL